MSTLLEAFKALKEEELKEDSLNEDIESVYNTVYANGNPTKGLPAIDRETFNKVISIDPLTKSKIAGTGEDHGRLGNYARWLLNLQLKGKDVLTKAVEIKKALTQFETNKNKLPVDKRDINKFKSPEELISFIENGEETPSELHKEVDKRDDVKFIASSSNYEVYEVLSMKGAIFLRNGPQGNRWCTAGEYGDPTDHWHNYMENSSRSDPHLYNFLHKSALRTRSYDNFQVYFCNGEIREIQDGFNGTHGGKIGATDHSNASRLFSELLLRNPDLALKLENTDLGKYPEVKDAAEMLKKFSVEAFTYDGKLLNTELPSDAYRTLIKKVEISPDITEIKPFGLAGYSAITEITIPSSITKIADYAFRDCTKLTTVYFTKDSKLKSIGAFAFQGCKNLKLIAIPPSCEYIGAFAFIDCNNLKIHILTENGTSKLTWDKANTEQITAKYKTGRLLIIDAANDNVNK